MKMKASTRTPAVQVVAGVVVRSGRFLLARRPAGGHLAGLWEFPGGKVRPGEALEAALARELEEEVGLQCRDRVLLHVEEHAYPDRAVAIHFFLCLDPGGEPTPREGQEIGWFTPGDLSKLDVPAANRRLIELVKEQFA
jgi:8-oxo-dGTP diphosphatase